MMLNKYPRLKAFLRIFPRVVSLVCLTVVLHELGHLTMGLLLGGSPEVFSLGLGLPPMFKLAEIHGITIQVTPWLLGGYVKFHVFNEISITTSIYKDLIIAASGVGVNYALWGLCRKRFPEFAFHNKNLALFNSIPISALDGGRFAFLVTTLFGVPNSWFIWFVSGTTIAWGSYHVVRIGLTILVRAWIKYRNQSNA